MAKRKYLNYEETMNLAERFMKVSGIRGYCEYTCKGNCCGPNCYNSDRGCQKNGKRLACSFYICNSLRLILFSDIRDVENLFNRLKYGIMDALEKANRDHRMEPYFRPYEKHVIEDFKLYNSKTKLEKLIDSAPLISRKIIAITILIDRRDIQDINLRNIKEEK